MSESRRRGVVLSTRISGEELALLQDAADRTGVLVSVFVREAALTEALRSKSGAQTKRLPNGGELIWWTNAPGQVGAG